MKNILFGFINLILFNICLAQNWEKKTDVPVELAFPVVVELKENIHVIGGGGPSGATNMHLRYRPIFNKWDTLPPVPFLAQQPAGAVVNGKIHFCGGGYPNTGSRLNKHYYYDSDSNKWFQAPNLPIAVAIHKAVSFDNKLYILSGQPDKTLCEYYDPVSKSWVQKNALPDQNFWYSGIVSTTEAIFRFGGGGFGNPTNAAHTYDKANDTWIPIPVLPMALHALAASALNDSLILIAGGYGQGITYDKAFIYHTLKKKYYPTDAMPFGTNYHSLVTLGSCVYSVGGDNQAVINAGTSLIKICSPIYKWAVSVNNPIKNKPYEISRTPDKIAFVFQEMQISETYEVEIFNFLGKKIIQRFHNTSENTIVFNSSDFGKGNYLLTIKTEKGLYFEKWIIL